MQKLVRPLSIFLLEDKSVPGSDAEISVELISRRLETLGDIARLQGELDDLEADYKNQQHYQPHVAHLRLRTVRGLPLWLQVIVGIGGLTESTRC